MTANLDDLLAATARIGRPEPARRWPYGPTALRCGHNGRHKGEHKGYTLDLDTYLALLRRAEIDPAVPGQERFPHTTVQRLRLLYYGQRVGNSLFDRVLDTDPRLRDSPMTTDRYPQDLLDQLFRTGPVLVGGRDRSPVDVSHIWVLADRRLNGLSTLSHVAGLFLADVTGLLSWMGDLASWWIAFNDRRIKARLAAVAAGRPVTDPVFTEPMDEASLEAGPRAWLAEGAARCDIDDLLGDIDAMVLMPEFGRLRRDTSTPIADLLAAYYGLNDRPDDRAHPHVDNRFHLFVQRASPEIPHEPVDKDNPTSGVRLAPDAGDRIRSLLKSAIGSTLLTVRLSKSSHHATARRAFPEIDPLVVPPTAPFPGGDLPSQLQAQLYHELASPWGAAMLTAISERLTAFLTTGLEGEGGWRIGDWPTEPSPLHRWGGAELAIGAVDPAAPGGETSGPGPVRRLQLDLDALGFTTGTPDGSFGPRTAVALREFQIEAQSPRMYVPVRPAPAEGYEVVPADRRHFGPVNGVLDEQTAAVLSIWVDLAKVDEPALTRPLNPLRVKAYRHSSAGLGEVVHDDVWRYDDVQDQSLLVCATDSMRRHWHDAVESGGPVPVEFGPTGEQPLALGQWTSSGSGGPVLLPSKDYPTLWPSAKVTAVRCADPDRPPLPPGLPVEPSQYRAVAAIAHVEVYSNFDVHNCWDVARFSIGLCHWTLAADAAGELPALLGYYKHLYPEDYHRTIGRFGIEPAEPWPWPQDSGASAQAKFTGRLRMHGLHDALGVVRPGRALVFMPSEGGTADPDRYLLDWFRSWRGLFRFTMALRGSAYFRHAQYRFTLLRLETLLGRAFQTEAGPADAGPFRDDGTVADFGEVFTSERAVTALLRWHVNRPGKVVSGSGAVSVVRDAFREAYGTGRVLIQQVDPATADARQERLVRHLIDNAPEEWYRDSVRNAVDHVDPEYGPLSRSAGSFVRPVGPA
ncbi:peptidoglycan-binding domain-containing protein [Streptomyces lushanensis]|uniref:peptidoglycan-binding domain-containing protein n=1 Tax=Streptomyces lushanensis TaxID=1434255 RepID=UPI000830648A|nr:peptidoglycan-binding domain-containing protein [Streptomyces lushanensis]